MLSNEAFLLATVLVSFGLTLLITPVVLKVAHRQKWVAPTNHRTIHMGPIPRLGGVAMGLSFGVVIVSLVLVDSALGGWLPPISRSQVVLMLGLGLAATHLVGLLDDFFEFRAVYKGALQLGGALLAIGAGVVVDHLTVPFTDVVIPLGPFGPFLTLLWILGVTNAVNLIDGIDGLAGGYSAIALAVIGVWGLTTGHLFQAVACATGLGAVFGFLRFNWPPAKIFMGDSGSLSLGYLIAVLSAWGGEYSLFHQFWLLPFTLVLVPVGDTVSAVLRRLRANKPVWAPDREHTHHKLMALGFRPGTILLMLLGLVAATSWPVLLASGHPGQADNWLVGACLVSVGVVVAAFSVLHVLYRRRFPAATAPLATPLQRIS